MLVARVDSVHKLWQREAAPMAKSFHSHFATNGCKLGSDFLRHKSEYFS